MLGAEPRRHHCDIRAPASGWARSERGAPSLNSAVRTWRSGYAPKHCHGDRLSKRANHRGDVFDRHLSCHRARQALRGGISRRVDPVRIAGIISLIGNVGDAASSFEFRRIACTLRASLGLVRSYKHGAARHRAAATAGRSRGGSIHDRRREAIENIAEIGQDDGMLLAELRRQIVCGLMHLFRDPARCSQRSVVARVGPRTLHPPGKF